MRYREIEKGIKVWVKGIVLYKDFPRKQDECILVGFPDCPIRCKLSEIRRRISYVR